MSVQLVSFGTDLTFEDVSSVLFRELQGTISISISDNHDKTFAQSK